MKVNIPYQTRTGFGQIQVDSMKEAEAILWLAEVSPFPMKDIAVLWDTLKARRVKVGEDSSWEEVLKTTAEYLYKCSQWGFSVYRMINTLESLWELTDQQPLWGPPNEFINFEPYRFTSKFKIL